MLSLTIGIVIGNLDAALNLDCIDRILALFTLSPTTCATFGRF